MVSSRKETPAASGEPLAAIPVLKSADSETDLKEETSSFWEFCLYLPLLLQSLFGTLYFVRSLVLGHALSRLLTRLEEWSGPDAWPPPSFILFLGISLVTLIVHPDGFTWVLWRHVR